MATEEEFFILKSLMGSVDKSLLYQFLCRNMFSFSGSSWVLVFACICCVFGSIIRYLSRFRVVDTSRTMETMDTMDLGLLRERQIDSDEKGETEDSVVAGTVSIANTSQYQFMSGKDFSGFFEEPVTMSFTVQELYAGSIDGSVSNNPDPNIYKNFQKVDLEVVDLANLKGKDSLEYFGREFNLEAEDVDDEKAESGGIDLETGDVGNSKTEDSIPCIGTLLNLEEDDGDHTKTEESAGSFSDGKEVLEEQEQEELFREDNISEMGGMVGPENDFLGNFYSSNYVSENFQFSFGSNNKLIDSGDELIIRDHAFNSVNDDGPFLFGEMGEWLEQEKLLSMFEKTEAADRDSIVEEILSSDASFSDQQAECKDTEDEYLELESQLQNSNADTDMEGTNKANSFEKSDVPFLQKSPSSSDSDEDSRWEDLWEHGNLIDQLKLELKNVRTGGLPTILEESESPKIVYDLKPLRIEEKLEHKDRLEGIQKFYKLYADKMRKLDILNYQTVNAIGFLQFKDPVRFNSNTKPSAPAIKSLLSQKTSKLKRLQDGPTLNLIRELKNNLEIIYVGQICLSWEILQWQYGKALELQDYDHDGFRRYSQVTGEFEQFQVLVHRFIENEPFQGPRMQCYVKNRCLVHKLLHVPPLKDDSFKDKKERTETGQDAATISMLIQAIEKSMRVFWDFLRADKSENGLRGSRVDLQNPADIELLMNIQTDLQKKEKRLKDLLRSKNCIVKRLQKHKEDRLDRSLLSAQVELKLVSRALKMSRLTTDQLAWCRKKLSQINIVNRKIQVEPSFLLFP